MPFILHICVVLSYSGVLSCYFKSLYFEKCTQEYIMTNKHKPGFTYGHCNIAIYESHLYKSDSLFLVIYPFHFNIFDIYDSEIQGC